MPAERPPSRWLYLVGAAVVVGALGISAAVGYLVSLLFFFVRLDSLPRAVVPGTVELELPAGDYSGYLETHSLVGGKAYQVDVLSGLTCRLADSSGAPVQLRRPTGQFSYDVGSYSGHSQFVFRAPRDGRYTLACGYGRQDGPQVVLAVGRGPHLSGAVLLVGGIGGIATGVAICVVAQLRRRRWTRTRPTTAEAGPYAGASPPPPEAAPAYAGAPPGGPGPFPPGPLPPGPPVAGPPVAGPPVPGAALPRRPVRTDRLGVVTLMLAVLGVVVAAVPLAVVSLARPGSGARRDRGLAVAALAVSTVWVLAGAATAAALVPSRPESLVAAATPSASASPSAEPTSAGTEIGFTDLRVGDCIESKPRPGGTLVRVPCAVPHELEVIAIPDLGSGPWPGDTALQGRSDRLCSAAFRSYVGIPLDRTGLDPIWYLPDEEAWRQGDHTVDCLASDPAGKTTGTVRGSHR